jgi:hypothetical protein
MEWHYREESQVALVGDGFGMLRERLKISGRAARGAYRRRGGVPDWRRPFKQTGELLVAKNRGQRLPRCDRFWLIAGRLLTPDAPSAASRGQHEVAIAPTHRRKGYANENRSGR